MKNDLVELTADVSARRNEIRRARSRSFQAKLGKVSSTA